MSELQAQVISSASASVSSESSFNPQSPLGVKKSELLEIIGEKEVIIKKLNFELNELKKEIKDIDSQLSSPTTARPDIARSCVFVGPKKTGKYRQLHISELGRLYYFTDSFRKAEIESDRETFVNAEVRKSGKSIWDGNKISRHAGDQEEEPNDLEIVVFDDGVSDL